MTIADAGRAEGAEKSVGMSHHIPYTIFSFNGGCE
jgi:hypothetical protein